MKRIISLLLGVCLILGIFPVTVKADEIQTKYLKVSVNEEVKTYECLWDNEEIYCSVESLAEISNYDWNQIEGTLDYYFFKEYGDLVDYSVQTITNVTISIDDNKEKAYVEAMGESYTMDCYFAEEELFLPLEKLLYLLHVEWIVEDDTVYVTPMPLTILDFVAIHGIDLINIATQSEEVLINTGWILSDTKFGQAVYSSIAEVFNDFDGKIFMFWLPGEGHVETAESYENAILQLAREDEEFITENIQQDALESAVDSAFYLHNNYMSKIQNIMVIPENIDDIVQSVPDAVELLEDMGKKVPKLKKIAEDIEDGKIDSLFLSNPELKSTTKQLEQIGDGIAIMQCVWNVYDTAFRVQGWDDEYLTQLQILADYEKLPCINEGVANYVRDAAQRLIDSYTIPSEAATDEALQSTVGLLLSKTFDASPFGKAFSIMNAVGSCYGLLNVEFADTYDMYAELSNVSFSVKVEQMVKYLLDYNNLLNSTEKLTNEKLEEYRNQLMLYLRLNLRNKVQLYNLNIKGNEDKNWINSQEAKELYDEIVLVYVMLAELIEIKDYDAFVVLESDLDNLYGDIADELYFKDVAHMPISSEILLDEKKESEHLSRINYYDSEGKLIYYESYAYYDNDLLCSKTLHSVNYRSDGTYYTVEIYTFLYLYDNSNNLKETILDAFIQGEEYYNSDTGEVVLDYEYDTLGITKKTVIYPKSESIEQEKFGVDSSKTEKIYDNIPVIFTNSNNDWATLYLDEIFSEEEPTDRTTGRFLYIDDNVEPELWLDYYYGSDGAEIFTTGNGNIDKIFIDHGVANWIEHNNVLLVSEDSYFGIGMHFDTIYKIENGKFDTLVEGNCVPNEVNNSEYDYYWNEVKITENEYKQSLNEFFDKSNAVDINQNIYTYKQCKLLLQAIADKNNQIEKKDSVMSEEDIYNKLVEHYKRGTEDDDGTGMTVMQGSFDDDTYYSTSVRCGVPGNDMASQCLYEVVVNAKTGEVTQTRVLTDGKVTIYNLYEEN